ncbi:slipin family protein [Roseibacillus persicicus]|uniref:slipin family protein n=1 Tax=Roseibacillus persicicus TaxID=454148 RepID=UPI00398A548F
MNIWNLMEWGALALALIVVWRMVSDFRKRVVVEQHELAMHFRNGVFRGLLEPGVSILWGRGNEVTRLDRRWQEMVVQGQEFLTADRAGVKVSGVVRYRIVDGLRFVTESANPVGTLHAATQMALRDVIGVLGLEAVLERQADLGPQLKELVQSVGQQIGIEVETVVARDLMLNGDLKRAYQASLVAKQEALAALEKARGEAAAMRVMANGARVFEKNPTLLQLRALDVVSKAGEGYNNHLVIGSLETLMSAIKTD